jgi:hypothetical protein
MADSDISLRGSTGADIYLTDVSTAPVLFVNVAGTWKQATSISVNVGGTWKTLTTLDVNVAGTWKGV